jgi:hypothetical protein
MLTKMFTLKGLQTIHSPPFIAIEDNNVLIFS